MTENLTLEDMQDADLGLGDGLKPGGLTILSPESTLSSDYLLSKVADNSDNSSHSGYSSSGNSDEEFELTLMPIRQIHDLKTQFAHLMPSSDRCCETNNGKTQDNLIYDERYFCDKSASSSCKCEGNCPQYSNCELCDNNENGSSNFPTYANIPYGTSMRQQKELFNRNIEELRKKMTVSSSNSSTSVDEDKTKAEHHKARKKRSSEEIAMKLAETLLEVEDLKIELETCEQRLDSKYKAIDILRKQAEEAQSQLKFTEKSSKVASLKMSQEINELQYEVESRENSLMDSQQVWAQRFDRMCLENKSLMNTLETRLEELRKVTSQKIAVERDNDELLALLDIQERAKYEKSRSVSSEENYCTFSSTELAVLGACRCRVTSPEPCGCAHAAANLKKEIVKMKQEIQLFKTRRDEAFYTVDAYRKAFEEQLQRNKSLTLQLANISTGRNNASSLTGRSKAKVALRWLIGSLNDEDMPEDEGIVTSGPTMSQHELTAYLTEMLNEKKEVLAHQKLAAQILADRVRVLEGKLTRYEKEDVFM